MSPTTKPAVVLVHGSWHVPEHYSHFIQPLQSAGFEVTCPLLPSCDSEKRSAANMYDDAATVRSHVTRFIDDSRKVIMLLHSNDGAVGTEASKGLSNSERTSQGLKAGVIRLICMCAFMLQVGGSAGSVGLPRPVPEPVNFFYAHVHIELAKRMEALLARQSGSVAAGVITYPAWKYIPLTYIKTSEDRVLFPEWQERMIKAMRDVGADLTVETVVSSHSPFLSMPANIVGTVKRAVEQHVVA